MSSYDAELLDEEDEDMPLTERDLADDAQWKIIQKNTFTRWANEHLKTVNKNIASLDADLGDGLRLIGLVEVLSGKKFKHVNKRPNFRTQKLENVTMVLEFLERDEGIRIVNIDSGDIVDSKLKLILGLIWTLILHYSISMPMWEGEELQPQEGGPTPKQRLLNWIQNKIPDLPIKNLTSDFNNGIALGALVDAIAPGLCPDWEDWDPKKAKENAKEALDAAEKWLDVPQLVKPDEMTNPKIDDLSMMTYLSQFPHAKLKPGAPLRPRLNANRVRAFGPGLEPKGNRIGQPAKFSVETFSAGKGELEIIVLDPKGKQATCEQVFTKDRNQTYACTYVPSMEGEYRVIIKFGSKEIHKSPFLVKVEGAAGDPAKVKASGPGLEKTGVVIKEKTYFEVFTKEAGKGEVTVTIMDTSGHKDKIKPTVKPQPGKEGVYLVEYTAMEIGLHSVNVSFCNQPIPGSPFGVNVSAASNAKAVYATGRGIQPRGIRVKQHAEFKVHTKDAGKADVTVQIIGPGGVNLNCKVTLSKTEEGVYECIYIPPKVGQYVINITFGREHITKSPFRVDVGPEKFSKVVAFGPGLEGGVVNQPACFTVETNGETGALGFSIEGPSQAKIDCKDNGDGSADVTYWPTAPGEYAIHIMCNDEDIPQAPYMAQILPATTAFDASKVTAKGPGLEPTGVVVGKWTEFTVDSRKAGKASLHITCLDATYKPVNVEVKDNKDGTFSCKYNPKNPVKHTIIITWGSVGIPKSPFRVIVQEPTKPGNVKVYGPGVEKGVKTFVKTHFKVDCRSAGPGDVAIALTDERGKDVPVVTTDNKDGTFTVEYEPTTIGTYIVSIFFAEKEIPLSPIKVKVESSIDLSKVVVKGLETPIKLSEKRTIRVITSRAKRKDAPCSVSVTMTSGKTVELTVRKTPEGYSTDFVPTESGKHKFTVTYAGLAHPDSPFTIMVESTARLIVKGLETPIQVEEARLVTIITSGLPKKDGPCKVTVTTPKKKTVELTCKKSPDGYTTTFTPTEPGTHKVEVVYDRKPAPDSPFTVEVEPKKVTPEVVVKGLESPIPLGETRPISIVTSSMPKKDAPCKVTCTNPKGKVVELPVKKSPDGYTTSLKPTEVGPHKVTVTYDKKPVPKSPFPVEVEEPCVKVTGLETPIQVGEDRPITIDTSSMPKKDSPCKVSCTNPKGKTVELPCKKSPDGYTTTFTPTEPGTHKVEVVYNKKPVPHSPFKVEVEPKKVTPEVVVKGLETPIPLGETRPISIVTSSMPKKDAPCKVTCTNPKGKVVELPVKKSPDGYTTSLKPTEVGPHKVTVTYDKKPVPNSPFPVEVEEPCVKVTGLDEPIQVGEDRPITIDTSSMPKKDSPCKVSFTNPKGKTVELPVTKSPEGYTSSLKPTEVGPHKVEVNYNNKPVPKSPFPVEVKPKETKPKPVVEVTGLDTPVQVGEKRPVKIITTNAPKKEAPCKVTTTNPKGRTAEMKIKKTPEGYEGTFAPWDKGTHTVKVEYDSKELPESPFEVIVEKVDITKVVVQGLDTPIELGSTRTIIIITKDTGRVDSICKVYATSETKETIELTSKLTTDGYTCDFIPTRKGKYTIKIEYGGKEVPKSPFEVMVETIDISGVTVKGLETPVMVTEKRPVIIDTTSTGRPDTPCKVSFMNPKNVTTELPTSKNPKGHETIFSPTELGPHKVKVEVAGQEVPGSPFPVTVEKFEVKPVVKGLETPVNPGEKRDVQIIAPTEKTSKFGPGPSCTVTATTPKGKTTELKVTKATGKFETEFTSRELGEHKVKVEYNSKDVPGSPFTVVVEKKGTQPGKPDDVDVTKVQVKGLEKPVQVGEIRPITVDTTSTGKPDVPCKLTATNPKGQTKELPTKKTPEGYEATFAPLEEGPHIVKVEVADKEVPKSPFPVKVEPKMELSKVEVKGLDKPIMVGEKRPVEVKTGKTDLPCKITATSPKGKPSDVPTSKTPDGYQATFAPLEPGPYVVKVEVAGQDVPKSPFKVDVEPKTDLNKVEVKGLETPVKLGEKRPVTITTASTGNPEAPCKVTATGPKGKPTECPIEKTKTGYEATFAPLEEGPHIVKVEVAKKEIPKSPFKVPVEPKLDLTKVDVKGLEKPVEVDESRPVLIVTKDTGDENAPCKVTATTPSGRTMFIPTKKGPDGYESTFKPKEIGPHEVKVEYGGIEVPKSPIKVEVEPKMDIKKLKVKGLEKPIPLGETRELEVVTAPTGKTNLPCKVSAKGPNMPYEELPLEKTDDGYKALYTPKECGPHDVHVIYADKEVPNSPFYVNVETSVEATEVKVKGLESPIEVGEPRPVTINTASTGKPDAPCRVTVTNPRGLVAELPTQRTPEGYGTIFAPAEPGPHKVNVNFAGQEVPRSPFTVNVEPRPDVGAVVVRGLETPIEVGEPRPINIDTSNTGRPDAPCWVAVTNPRGQTAELPVQMTPKGYQTVFAPLEPGPHQVNVNFAGKEVPRSPFPVNVEPRPDVGAVYVQGLETPIEVGEPRPITIDTSNTGRPDAPCWVAVTNPRGQTAKLPVQMTPNGYQTVLAPLEPGPHQVNINFAGKEVPRSPFPVNVEPKPDVGAVYVQGLETPIEVGEPRPITVDTSNTGRPDAPCMVAVTNPRGQTAELPVQMTPKGYQAVFAPLEPGPHQVNVNFAGKEVPRSPFPVNVEPRPDVTAVYVHGLETPIEVGEPRPITVDTSNTGRPDAPCMVVVTNPRGQTAELPTQMTPNGYQTVFAPLEPGPHQVNVNFAGKEVPRSPFPVNVEPRPDVTAVYVHGLETPIEVGEPRPITVDTSNTGRPDAPCMVVVTNPRGQTAELPTQMTPNGYQTVFAPLEPGPHQVNVNFAGKEVPRSPFPVNVEPRPDVTAVYVHGLETPIEVGEPRPINIDTSNTGRPDAPCWVAVTNPRGQTAELPVQMTPKGYQTVLAPLEPGPHQVNVNFAGKEVPRSPFTVNVEPKPDVGAVYVRGLETPIEVGEPRPIIVDTSNTGRPDAPCWVAVTNPRGQTAELPVQMTPKGYQTVLAPQEPGPHQVDVNFAGYEVPRSPFTVFVEPRPNVGMVQVFGLDSPIQVDEARPIKVNTAATGKPDAPCRVTTSNPQGQVTELVTKKTPDGYQAIFAPLAPGPHKVNVNFAGQEVPKSPFTVDVEPRADVSKVEVLGLEKPIKVAEPRPVTIMTSTTGKPDAPCSVRVTNPRGETTELPTRKIPEGYTATLAPLEEGPHTVNVVFDGVEVPKSPFNVMAEPAIDFSKVKVRGLDAPVEVGEIRPVTIDTAECGVVDAPCQVTATNPVGQVRELPMKKTPKGYEAQFSPLEDGPHMVAVKYAGKELPKSPFPVEAKPQGPAAAKVKVYGPGLEKGTAKEPCYFTIDTREVTQPGGLGVTVEGPAESKIECRDNQDGTCDVTYHPTVPGDYCINVTYAEEHVTNSPFHAAIKPSTDIDVSNVKAYGPGLEPGVFLDSPTGFTVDAKSVTPTSEGKVRAIVTSPTGQRIESLVKSNEDGTYDVLYTPYEQGPNTIDVTYEDIPIPQSPIQVNAAPGCDASRVRAYGPGLDGGVTDVKQTFTVDVKGAGQGGLALAIDGPAETQINCKDNRDGTCEVEYTPVKQGDYDVTIKFADKHIPGSPFNVKVKNPVNPAKVQCYGPGLDSKDIETGKPATFTVDTTEAGEAPLEVTYTDQSGVQKPAEIVPVVEGKYNATYYPVEEGKCKIEVKYANQHVPNSPFTTCVEPGVDANKVEVTGDGIQPEVLASMPCHFVIDCRKAGIAELDVVIQRPDGTFIRPSIQDNGDGTFTVQYTPEDLGPYKINITYGGQPVPGAPFRTVATPTGDATKCRITEGYEHTVLVEKQTVISIDASNSGTGKVTCRIRSPEGTEIDIDICENGDGSFSIMFTPAYPGDYKICIKFGGETIPDGEYIIQAVTYDEYEEYLQKKAGEEFITPDTVDAVHAAAPSSCYNPIDFKIPVGPIFNFVTAHITMPSGNKAYPKIEDNKDGTITCRYQPKEVGLHELTVCYNQQPIQGSPFQFHVDEVNSGFVTAYGPGLSHGVANEPAEFTIVTKDAGAGGLALAIEGPSKTEIKCKDNENGTCTVSYVPTAPGEYNITVKFADKHISGSPFTSKITPGEKTQRAQLGRSSEVSLKVTETDITSLTASIRSPSGVEEPCMLKRLPNGHLGISFTPREVGEHLVNVFRDGKHIADSPFKIYVGESELGNASKVRVYGKGLEEGVSSEVNEFIVDTREAGYGGLSLSIEGPSKADIECHDNEDGTCRVTYKPTEPGTYVINIKFADEHVPGSPYKVKISGEPSERITERIMRHREAADVTHVGSQCELSLKIPGTSPFDMTASVTNPSGVTELCDVVSLDDSHYSIKFVPQEMGVHTVSVKHKDMHIPGSPFEFTVGPIAGGGAHKVHAAGLGLVRGEVDEPCEFNIYTREAGAGGLSIAIEGPSKAEVGFEDRKDGSCGVNYTVSETGEYIVSIKFNDEHIPDSPFRVPISPSIGDARKISVSALKNKGLQIGQPCAFIVNFNGAPKGKLTARVVTPSAMEDEALIQEIDDGEYAIRFIPRENGPHLVYVSFDGCQIPDSPFRIQVGTVHADPGMVTAYGDGLRTGKTGSQCKFIVNTCNAGAGALAVTVEGPSKVKLECKEVDDGYEFTYNPTAPGDYLITIRYAGTSIAASPFKAKIEGPGKSSGFHEQASVVVETVTKTSVTSKFASLQSADADASKVTCEGNGLKKGYRNKQCTFTVDTSQAGRNMLFIGMAGPKGPCEELIVKHIPGSPYKITYIVKERGDYMLAVKWGESHIPGSPFIVKVD